MLMSSRTQNTSLHPGPIWHRQVLLDPVLLMYPLIIQHHPLCFSSSVCVGVTTEEIKPTISKNQRKKAFWWMHVV